jgi:hypothetical protein
MTTIGKKNIDGSFIPSQWLMYLGLLIWALVHSKSGGPYFAHTYKPDALLADSLGTFISRSSSYQIEVLIFVHSLGSSVRCNFSAGQLRRDYSWPSRLVSLLEEREPNSNDCSSDRLSDIHLCYM